MAPSLECDNPKSFPHLPTTKQQIKSARWSSATYDVSLPFNILLYSPLHLQCAEFVEGVYHIVRHFEQMLTLLQQNYLCWLPPMLPCRVAFCFTVKGCFYNRRHRCFLYNFVHGWSCCHHWLQTFLPLLSPLPCGFALYCHCFAARLPLQAVSRTVIAAGWKLLLL